MNRAASGLFVAAALVACGQSEIGRKSPRPMARAPESVHATALELPAKDATLQTRPLVVVLHGMCSAPEIECPAFAELAEPIGLLLCPRAPTECTADGGTAWLWPFEENAALIDEARDAAFIEHPGGVEPLGGILVGFSFGALVATELAHRGDGKYRGLVLIGAEVHPDAKLLADASVERVVLAAGEYDMMRPHMESIAASLRDEGIATRFVDLGPIGHAYPDDMTARMRDAMLWASGLD